MLSMRLHFFFIFYIATEQVAYLLTETQAIDQIHLNKPLIRLQE